MTCQTALGCSVYVVVFCKDRNFGVLERKIKKQKSKKQNKTKNNNKKTTNIVLNKWDTHYVLEFNIVKISSVKVTNQIVFK